MFLIVLAIANIHGHFKTESHFSCCWFCPHSISP